MTLEPFTIAFTADNKFVLVGGPSKSLILLDVRNGKAVRSYPKQKDVVRYLEASPDGSAVAVAFFDEKGSNIPAPVMIFEISSGNIRAQWLPETPIIGGGWMADGRLLLATATPESVTHLVFTLGDTVLYRLSKRLPEPDLAPIALRSALPKSPAASQ
jgi:hypothetical protein